MLEPTLNALEDEMRERMNDNHDGTSKNEMMWPIHQINWQRSRYVYDMHFVHNRISRQVLNYCVQQKYADSALIAKWKRPEYARLCCIQAIDRSSTAYGNTSICRVPKQQLGENQFARNPFSGCRGCASGKGGYSNILVTSTASDLQRSKFSEKSF